MEQRIGKVGGVITLEPSWELPRISLGTRTGWIGFARVLALGLAITLVQITLAWCTTGKKDFGKAYLQLWMWDGAWYASVAVNGYELPEITPGVQGNTSFFPAYPLFARGLMELFDLDAQHALLLASQACAWGFWVYVLLFLRRWHVPTSLAAIGVLLIAAHPGSFFLVASYTESMFLFGLLGFLYWSAAPRWSTGLLAGLHGIVMTGSRVVGVPLVIVPLALAIVGGQTAASEGRVRRFARAVLMAVLASVGGGLFFLHCHQEFGHWDQYLRSSTQGWGAQADYLGLLTWKIFQIGRPNWHELVVDPGFLSRLSVPITLALFVGLLVMEVRLARRHADSGWRQRLGFYLCALIVFYISASGNAERQMTSMVRYTQCVLVLLVLPTVHLLKLAWPLKSRHERVLTVGVTGWVVMCFTLQVLLTYRYTHGLWVA